MTLFHWILAVVIVVAGTIALLEPPPKYVVGAPQPPKLPSPQKSVSMQTTTFRIDQGNMSACRSTESQIAELNGSDCTINVLPLTRGESGD